MQPHLMTLLTSLVLTLLLPTQLVAGPIQQTYDPFLAQKEAIRALDIVLERRRKTGDIVGTVSDLRLIGRAFTNLHQNFIDRGEWAEASLSAAKLGYILRLLNMPAEAKQSFEYALQHSLRAKHVGHQVTALLGLAKNELYRTGAHDYQAVARYLDQARELAEAAGDKQGLCDAHQVRAELELEQRQYLAALDAINRSFPLTAGLADPMMPFYAHQTRGMIYSEWAGACDYDREAAACAERLDKAKQDFEKAQELMRSLGYEYVVKAVAVSLKNVETKRALIKLKETDKRLSGEISKLQRTLPVLVDENFLPPKTSDMFADSPALLNNMKLLLEEQIRRTSDGATGTFLRGRLKDILDEPDAALDYYLKAVKLLETDSGSLQGDKSLGTYLEDKIQIYYEPMRHLLQRKRHAEAFDLMENSRTRAMADLLRQNFNVGLQEFALYAEFLTARSTLSLAQQQAFQDEKRFGKSLDSGALLRLQEKDYQKVLQDLNAANSKLLGLVAPQTATLASVQQTLKQDRSEILYYTVLDKQLIIWHLSGDQTHVMSVFVSRVDLINRVNLLRKSLDKNAEFDQQEAGELFRFLIQPALKFIKSDQLVIIPHEDLNYVPFQVLFDAERNKYVGEMFQLSYAPSATILTRLKKVRNISGGKLLAVDSTDLEAGENEVRALGQLFSNRSKIVIDPKLKESSLKSWIGDYDLVHLSIHGRFKNDQPLLSFLQLHPGSENEDVLTAAEMFGLPLSRAKLVVLSSCETGQVRATRANELIGMQRALLYAGANNLILPAWQVDPESTGLWMTTFYREAQTKPFNEAARLALVAVKSKYSHPYHWGPFLLIGK
jgi:CHAT domain-containing protein